MGAQPAASQPKYKGIWEPVNYQEDLGLTDVFFVSAEKGWVAGAAGTILHTSDGGATWTPQLGGDPQSQEPAIEHLRFLDESHGWALQSAGTGVYKLLRTDGETWQQTGSVTIGLGLQNYTFSSPTNGVYLDGHQNGSRIMHTTDGGRNWKEVFNSGSACRTKMQVQGLTQEVGCRLSALQMVSSNVGYAVGEYPLVPNALALLKTENGGATWQLFAIPEVGQVSRAPWGWQGIFFLDENTGVLVLNETELHITTDGGQSWRGLIGTAGFKLKFADPEVGWSLAGFKLSYTMDGGKRWSSRDISFPAWVKAFSLPRRDRAYAVGDHGMIYRYRVVPASEQVAANAIPAPAMPGLTDTLTPDLAEIREDSRLLQSKLGGPKPGATSGAGQSAPASPDTPSAPPSESAPPSDFIQDCCSSEIAELQTDVGSFVQDVPLATGKYRTLNLIMAGLRMASDLASRAGAMRDSFRALKSAPNRDAALLALQDLLTNVDSAGQTLAGGFDSPPALPDVPPGEEDTAEGGETPQQNAQTAPATPAQAPIKPTLKNKAKEGKKRLKSPRVPF